MFISGEKMVIKVGDGGDPEQFDIVGGLRTSSIRLRNEEITQNDLSSGKWQKIALDGGISNVVISGIGFFTNSTAEETIRGYGFNRSHNNYEFLFGNGNVLKGTFMVNEYQREGTVNETSVFSISLISSGVIDYQV